MNQFEEARLRAEKRIAQQARYQERGAVENPVPVPQVVAVQKEKPVHEGIIEVKVILPDREIVVRMKKPHIYSNTERSRLTANEVKRCVQTGFRSMLGELDDLPGGS